MNRDEKPEDPLAGLDPIESVVKETTQDMPDKQAKVLASGGDVESFAAWLERELEKLEAMYQGFSTSKSRRTFFGR